MMGKRIDMTGMKYERLTVIDESNRSNGHICWNVVCDCGIKLTVRGVDLRNGNTKSCGCMKSEATIKRNKLRKGKKYKDKEKQK